MEKYLIILLAAGSSSRFGTPKQLAQHKGQSFIAHAVSEAIKVTPEVIAVLGANYDAVKKEIENFPVQIVYNQDWEEGMSSSIRCGLLALLHKNSLAEAVIIVVCDQPFLSSVIMEELIKKYETTHHPIVACQYKNTIGTPALFNKTFFKSLLELKDQAGAKKILLENKSDTLTIPFPLGYIDIDTKKDYESLESLNKN